MGGGRSQHAETDDEMTEQIRGNGGILTMIEKIDCLHMFPIWKLLVHLMSTAMLRPSQLLNSTTTSRYMA